MDDALDVELQDEVLSDEIRLVTELMVVAATAPDGLEQEVIDSVLGLDERFPRQRDRDWDL